jgi:very-short-patch-repair endonuclease
MIQLMIVPRDNNPRLLRFAREMRKGSTDAEKKLWSILRGRRLSGFKFRRQHRIGGYILDFYCVRYRVAIELDGGQHNDPAVAQYDAQRTQSLNELGIRVLRFWDDDPLRDAPIIAEEIFRQLSEQAHPMPSPQPSPGVPGDGNRRNAVILPLANPFHLPTIPPDFSSGWASLPGKR